MIRRVMPAMANPSSHEDGPLPKKKTGGPGGAAFQDCIDFRHKLRSEPFVGVQVKDPRRIERYIGLSPVSLRGVVLKRVLSKHRATSPRDFRCLVCTVGVNHKDAAI